MNAGHAPRFYLDPTDLDSKGAPDPDPRQLSWKDAI